MWGPGVPGPGLALGQARAREVWGKMAGPRCWVSLVPRAMVLAPKPRGWVVPVKLVESDIQIQNLGLWRALGPMQSHGCHRSHGDATGLRPHFWHLLIGVIGQQPLLVPVSRRISVQGPGPDADLERWIVLRAPCRHTFGSGLGGEASGPLTFCCVMKFHSLAFGQQTYLHGSKIRVPQGVPWGSFPTCLSQPVSSLRVARVRDVGAGTHQHPCVICPRTRGVVPISPQRLCSLLKHFKVCSLLSL